MFFKRDRSWALQLLLLLSNKGLISNLEYPVSSLAKAHAAPREWDSFILHHMDHFMDLHYIRREVFISRLTPRPWLYNEFNLLDSSSCLISHLSLSLFLSLSLSVHAYIYCQAKITEERIALLNSHLVKNRLPSSNYLMRQITAEFWRVI